MGSRIGRAAGCPPRVRLALAGRRRPRLHGRGCTKSLGCAANTVDSRGGEVQSGGVQRTVPGMGDSRAPAPQHCVLVVEDEPDTLDLLGVTLEQAGFSVLSASTGAQALAVSQTSCPDIIVADIGLPDMDGYEMCRLLRADPATKSTPIVVVNGWFGAEDLGRAMDAGCDRLLIKPCPPETLVAELRRLLAASRDRSGQP